VLWFKVLGETVYRRLIIVELPLAPPPAVRAASRELTFGFLEPRQVDAYLALRPDQSAAAVAARLRRGDRCFVAREGDRIVSARWTAAGTAWVEYLGRRWLLEPGDVYLYETYTHPDVRGDAVSSAAGTRLARALAAEGWNRIVGGVVPENRPALRTASKTGYQRTGTMGYVRLGPWRRDFVRRSSA
jgi:GNAT superfamily N-acetyltransferase